jgi:hypothetical protein
MPLLSRVNDPAAVVALEEFIEGYLDDRHQYLHGHNTIQIESLNGTAAKRVSKERNWTVMYAPLFDAGILEHNNGVPHLSSSLWSVDKECTQMNTIFSVQEASP